MQVYRIYRELELNLRIKPKRRLKRDVTDALAVPRQIIEWRGKPDSIRCDNGPELISAQLMEWAVKQRIKLHYIQPGNPQQNAYVERFNRTVRHEWLDQHLFQSIEYSQHTATKWLWHYNTALPNMSIGGITPYQKLAQAA